MYFCWQTNECHETNELIKFRYCKKAKKVEKISYFYKKLLLKGTSKQRRRFLQFFGPLKISELYSSQRPINTGFCLKMRHGFLIRGKQKVPVWDSSLYFCAGCSYLMNFRLESLELKANPNFWQILGREKLFSLILPICNRECLCHRAHHLDRQK